MSLKDRLFPGFLHVTGEPFLPKWSWWLKETVSVEVIEQMRGVFHGALYRWVGEENQAWEIAQFPSSNGPPFGAMQLVMPDFDRLISWLEQRLLEFFPESRAVLYPPPTLSALERLCTDGWVV